MKRKATLLVAAMTLALVLAGGVALAAAVNCTTNPCFGTPLDDIIQGTTNPETINALGGNDEVFASSGNDTASGGDGNDFVDGYSGNDTIYGGANADNKTRTNYPVNYKGLVGAEDSDTVYGGGGGDFIDLVTFDTPGSVDRANGGGGNDTIHAFDGKQDIINCGRGTGDHVYYDQGLDTTNNCEKKHPNVAPASAASAAAEVGESEQRPAQE